MKATNLFNKWVDLGKDEGMEVNHRSSVDFMLNFVNQRMSASKFKFLDIGCGNGWLVRKVSKIQNCCYSAGIDGAIKMIQKAKQKDVVSEYLHHNLDSLQSYKEKFDIIFSMEVLYYLSSPKNVIDHLYHNMLNKKGYFIMGIDHYLENKPSLNWPSDLNVDMHTLSMLEWKQIFIDVGFLNINMSQFGSKEDWGGTLVLYGEKY